MNHLCHLAFISTLLLLPGSLPAQTHPPTKAAIEAIEIDGKLEQLIVDPKQQKAYILNSNFGGPHAIHRVDLTTFKPAGTISAELPEGMTLAQMSLQNGQLQMVATSLTPKEESKTPIPYLLTCPMDADQSRVTFKRGEHGVNDYAPQALLQQNGCLYLTFCNTRLEKGRCEYGPGKIGRLDLQAGADSVQWLELPPGGESREFQNPWALHPVGTEAMAVLTGRFDTPRLGRLIIYAKPQQPATTAPKPEVFRFEGFGRAFTSFPKGAGANYYLVGDSGDFGLVYLFDSEKPGGAIARVAIHSLEAGGGAISAVVRYKDRLIFGLDFNHPERAVRTGALIVVKVSDLLSVAAANPWQPGGEAQTLPEVKAVETIYLDSLLNHQALPSSLAIEEGEAENAPAKLYFTTYDYAGRGSKGFFGRLPLQVD